MKIKTVATMLLIAFTASAAKMYAMKNNQKKTLVLLTHNSARRNKQKTSNVRNILYEIKTEIKKIGNQSKKSLVELMKLGIAVDDLKKQQKKININQINQKQKTDLLESVEKNFDKINFPCTVNTMATNCALSFCKKEKELSIKICEQNIEKYRYCKYPNHQTDLEYALGPIIALYNTLTKDLAQNQNKINHANNQNKTSHCPKNAGTTKTLTKQIKIETPTRKIPVHQKKQKTDIFDEIKTTMTEIINIGNQGKKEKELVETSNSLEELRKKININRISKTQQFDLLKFTKEKINEIEFSCTEIITNCKLVCYTDIDGEVWGTTELPEPCKLTWVHPSNHRINFQDILSPITSLYDELRNALDQKK